MAQLNTFGQDISQAGGTIVPTNQPISVTAIQNPQTPANIQPAPQPSAPTNAGMDAMLAANQANLALTAPGMSQGQPDQWQSIIKDFLSNPTSAPSQTSLYESTYGVTPGSAQSARAAAQTGLNTANEAVQAAQDRYNALQAQINGLDYQSAAVIPAQNAKDATGTLVTTPEINRMTAAQQRDILLQKAPLQLQALTAQADLAAAQGKATLAQGILQQANSQLDALFKAQSTDAQNQYDTQTANRKAVYDYATTQEKAQLDAQQKAADQAHTDKQNAIKNAQDLAKTAIASGQSDVAAKIAALDPNSPTYRQDLANLTGQIQDKSAQLDIQYKQAQIAKINSDIAAANAQEAAVDPNTLQGMLNVYKATGVLPSFGMSGKSPLRAQFYAALGVDSGIVTDANTNKTIRAGLTTAYKTQQNQYSANQTAINTLAKQLDLARQYSDSVSRTNSPLVNKYLLDVKQGVFGDPQTAALHNIVTTASYELAKILSGSSASIAGVTVSSAADATNLLNSAMSRGQFNEVLGLMEQEANFRLQSQKDTLTQMQKDLNNVGGLSQDLQNAPTVDLSNPYSQSSTGRQIVTAPDGTQVQIID